MTTSSTHLPRLKKVIDSVTVFIPDCFVPAALLSLAGIILLLGSSLTFGRLNSPLLSLNNLLIAMAILLSSFAAGFVLLVISFSKWIFVLLVFCRFWLCQPSIAGQASDLKVLQQHARDEIKSRRASLTRFGLLSILYLLLPMLIFCLAVVLKIVSLSPVLGTQALVLPHFADLILLAVIIVFGLALTTISLIAVPIAAMSKGTAMQTVKQTFTLSWKMLPQATVLSALILVLNTVVANPQVLTNCASLESYLVPSTNLPLAMFEQIWQGLVSIILFPLSLIPFCELLRYSLTEAVKFE